MEQKVSQSRLSLCTPSIIAYKSSDSSNSRLTIYIKALLLTTPDLSARPPKATKASTTFDSKSTIFVLFGNFTAVVFLFFFFEHRSSIEQHRKIQNPQLFIEDILIDLVLSFLRDGNAEVYLMYTLLLMMLIISQKLMPPLRWSVFLKAVCNSEYSFFVRMDHSLLSNSSKFAPDFLRIELYFYTDSNYQWNKDKYKWEGRERSDKTVDKLTNFSGLIVLFCALGNIQGNCGVFSSICLVMHLLVQDSQRPIRLHQLQLIFSTHYLLRFLQDLSKRHQFLQGDNPVSFFDQCANFSFNLFNQMVQNLRVYLTVALDLVSREGVLAVFLQHVTASSLLGRQICTAIIFSHSSKDSNFQYSQFSSHYQSQFFDEKQIEAHAKVFELTTIQTVSKKAQNLCFYVEFMSFALCEQMQYDDPECQFRRIPILCCLTAIKLIDSSQFFSQNISHLFFEYASQFLVFIWVGDEAILELDQSIMLLHLFITPQTIIIFIIFMRGHNSSFLLTEQTRYCQELFNKSINRVRKRINILSTSAVFTTECPESPPQGKTKAKGNGSGFCATIAKLTFDAEMIEQDLRNQMLQLKKSRKIVAILAQELKRKTNKAQQQMKYQVENLREEIDRQREANLNRGRKLAFQCQQRRRKGEQLKEKIQQTAKRVKKLQTILGCYTANQKLQII